MRKLSVFILGATLACGVAFSHSDTVSAEAATPEKIVYVGGMSAGFTLKTGGVQIIGICEVVTDTGSYSPAGQSGLRAGDTILKAGGIRVESVEDLNEIVNKSGNKDL